MIKEEKKEVLEWNYEVIQYQDMINKDQQTAKKALDQLKRNRMIVISGVPKIKELRQQHFEAAKLLQVSDQNKQCFSRGINCYNEEIISHFCQINKNNYLSYFKQNNIDIEEYPDLTTENDWSKIQFLKQSTIEISNLKFDIAVKFIELIEDLEESGLTKAKQKLSQNIKESEGYLSRTLYYTPQRQIRKEQRSIYPHYDCEILSVHNKDYYLYNDGVNKNEDIQQPKSGGLYFRNASGKDYKLFLKEDEIMIQNGLPIQLFSGKQLQAQCHWVQDCQQQYIGRLSHMIFVYPKLSTIMKPFDDSLNEKTQDFLQINNVDKDIVSDLVNVTNHWYKGVHFSEFIQNQRNQYNFIINLKKLGYPVKHNLSTNKISNKTVSVYHFDQIDSTHTQAEKWYNKYLSKNKVFVFRADQQKQGRGQNQNTWSSPLGNLYVTYLMKANNSFRLSLLPQTIALAVKRTLQDYIQNDKIKLKWINDVFVQDKKIAGILITTENIEKQNQLKLVISVGVNLNVNPLGDKSTSLVEVTKKKKIHVQEFFQILTKNMIRYCSILIEQKQYIDLKHELNQSLQYQNEKVEIWDEKFTKVLHKGVFKGVNDYGQAILQRETKQTIVSEGRMRSRQSISKKRVFIVTFGLLISSITFYLYMKRKKIQLNQFFNYNGKYRQKISILYILKMYSKRKQKRITQIRETVC